MAKSLAALFGVMVIMSVGLVAGLTHEFGNWIHLIAGLSMALMLSALLMRESVFVLSRPWVDESERSNDWVDVIKVASLIAVVVATLLAAAVFFGAPIVVGSPSRPSLLVSLVAFFAAGCATSFAMRHSFESRSIDTYGYSLVHILVLGVYIGIA
jgi:hypothetical protein